MSDYFVPETNSIHISEKFRVEFTWSGDPEGPQRVVYTLFNRNTGAVLSGSFNMDSREFSPNDGMNSDNVEFINKESAPDEYSDVTKGIIMRTNTQAFVLALITNYVKTLWMNKSEYEELTYSDACAVRVNIKPDSDDGYRDECSNCPAEEFCRGESELTDQHFKVGQITQIKRGRNMMSDDDVLRKLFGVGGKDE